MVIKKKTMLKNISKKSLMLSLTAILLFTSVFSSYEMSVSAVAISEEENILNKLLIQIVEDGSILVGAKTGQAIGNYVYPGVGGAVGTFVGGALGATVSGSLLNADLDWYKNSTESGKSTVDNGHGGGGRSFNYQYRKGVPTSQNTTNYGETTSMSLYNETKTWNNTTNNYDYTYNWYNPITNTYNTTNNYTYNSTYNTYNYVTYDVDYTTNYYIQDNRTYVSYYIINTNNDTQEKEETYVEMYYELPDGRNSLYLTADDVKGQYFPSNYSKYTSVAEDDGTTLGLWHLDGDLKDSSYWGNTAGSSFNNVYTEGIYSEGKKFSDSTSDFLELKLDKASLPSSWTLEWLEYVPKVEMNIKLTNGASNVPDYNQDSFPPSGYTSQNGQRYYYDGSEYDVPYDLTMTGYLGVDGSKSFPATAGYFVPYAVVCKNGSYSFYQNGNLVSESEQIVFDNVPAPVGGGLTESWKFTTKGSEHDFKGINVTNNSIKFYAPNGYHRRVRGSSYVIGDVKHWGSPVYYCSHPIWQYKHFPHKNAIIDEVRLSKGALYSGDSYVPSTQPFITNTVLVMPDNPQKHEIAFKTNINVSDARFGGVKPTYPTNGFVYVALDSDDKVESVQQYQEDGWYEIEAALYTGTDWVSLNDFNMEYLGIDGSDSNSGGGSDNNPDDDNNGTDDDNNDSSGGNGVQSILDGIGKFFDTLLNLVGKIIGLFSGFVDGVLELFSGFTVFTDGFSGFLQSAFGFIPPEAVNVIVSGITLIVILAIIKFLK